MKKIERKAQINESEFVSEYLAKQRPLIITDGMENWRLDLLSATNLSKDFATDATQLYDDLFNLIDIITIPEYINKYFNKSTAKDFVPYIRWYAQMNQSAFIWSDNFFDKIQNLWSLPYFLPKINYILPYSGDNNLYPNLDQFPAKAVFISAKGARTKLHYDPWGSDAVLCQIEGTKKLQLYSPHRKDKLCASGKCIDIDKYGGSSMLGNIDLTPDYLDILHPGEIVFFPHNWIHQVTTEEDSVSLTWNFVHISTWRDFLKYLRESPTKEEMEVIDYFTYNLVQK